jgi:hypothetical protein
MLMRSVVASKTMLASTAMLAFAMLVVPASSAKALTMKECSDKYKAAQSSGTLKGQKWNEFRKAECGTGALATPTAAPTTSAAQPAAKRPSERPSDQAGARAPSTTGLGTAGGAVFPSSVSTKYASESPGKARLHTCLDQYNANKADNRNGGLQWIQKGGGYYSECNKRLKG